MKAIILSAGKGSRLLPLTENKPKCLLPLDQTYSVLTWQLTQLEAVGVEEAVVVCGFQSTMVEEEVERFKTQMSTKSMNVRTVYNPFYHVADNLSTLWLIREELKAPAYMILNGDTIFTGDVAHKLIKEASSPITLTVSVKDHFDDDDMKVIRDGSKLLNVSKTLDVSKVDAESIGLMMFKDGGAKAFHARVEDIMRSSEGLRMFYLAVIDALASVLEIGTVEVAQENWQEIDYPVDYKLAKECLARWLVDSPKQAVAS